MIQLDEPRLRRVIGDILDTAPDVPGAPLEVATPTRRRWPVDLVAAAAVVGIGVAGVAVTRRDDRPTDQSAPTAAPAAAFAIPADGRLVFDPVPEGLRPANAERFHWTSAPETQVYVENRSKPELGAAVFVTAAPAEALPMRNGVEHVTVQAAPGVAYTELAGEHVAFGPVDDTTYYLDGYGMTRDELLAIAEGARLGEHDFPAIDPEFLPSGMTSLTAGSIDEGTEAFTPATLGAESVGASWFSDDQTLVASYGVRPEFGDFFAVDRLAHTSVRDVEVGGLDGFVSVDEYPSGQRQVVVTVTDGERTLSVFGDGYTEDEVIALTETLRPATDEEWAAMLLTTDDDWGDIGGTPPLGTES